MTENMKKFLEKVSADKALTEKVAKLDKDAVIALAKEFGFELTEADFAAPEGELASGELEAVTGGYKRCICVSGGGGKKDNEGDVCACVYGGAGLSKVDGEVRCLCAMAGTGYDSVRDHGEDGSLLE